MAPSRADEVTLFKTSGVMSLSDVTWTVCMILHRNHQINSDYVPSSTNDFDFVYEIINSILD